MTSVDRKRGIVLVVALWSIVLLSALAMAASTTFRVFGGMVSVSLDRAKAGALLDAGVAAGAMVLATLKEQQPLTAREFDVTLATGSVHVSLSDETGRINVNKAPPKVLSALLQYVGVEDADAIATSIAAWRGQDQGKASADDGGPTPPIVQQAVQAPGQNSQPNDAGSSSNYAPSFTDVRQLSQVPGVTDGIVSAIAPFITVFGEDKVNLLTAPPKVLAALPGMTNEQVGAIIEARGDLPAAHDRLSGLLGQSAKYVKPQIRPVALIEMKAQLADGYSESARATIVILPKDKAFYRVLAWTPISNSSSSAVSGNE
jgi:general secretion pathway protein K